MTSISERSFGRCEGRNNVEWRVWKETFPPTNTNGHTHTQCRIKACFGLLHTVVQESKSLEKYGGHQRVVASFLDGSCFWNANVICKFQANLLYFVLFLQIVGPNFHASSLDHAYTLLNIKISTVLHQSCTKICDPSVFGTLKGINLEVLGLVDLTINRQVMGKYFDTWLTV